MEIQFQPTTTPPKTGDTTGFSRVEIQFLSLSEPDENEPPRAEARGVPSSSESSCRLNLNLHPLKQVVSRGY